MRTTSPIRKKAGIAFAGPPGLMAWPFRVWHPARTVRGCRAGRTVSYALKSSVCMRGRSLARWERVTFGAGVISAAAGVVCDPEISMLMTCIAHDVWFRSFRDELSHTRDDYMAAQNKGGGVSPKIWVKLPVGRQMTPRRSMAAVTRV
jgi:hypothetical protein